MVIYFHVVKYKATIQKREEERVLCTTKREIRELQDTAI